MSSLCLDFLCQSWSSGRIDEPEEFTLQIRKLGSPDGKQFVQSHGGEELVLLTTAGSGGQRACLPRSSSHEPVCPVLPHTTWEAGTACPTLQMRRLRPREGSWPCHSLVSDRPAGNQIPLCLTAESKVAGISLDCCGDNRGHLLLQAVCWTLYQILKCVMFLKQVVLFIFIVWVRKLRLCSIFPEPRCPNC